VRLSDKRLPVGLDFRERDDDELGVDPAHARQPKARSGGMRFPSGAPGNRTGDDVMRRARTHTEEQMKSWIRAGVLGATGALALAFAGSAFSAINPRLTVGTTTQAGNTKTSIEARVGSSDDPIGRIQFFLPTATVLIWRSTRLCRSRVATVQSKQIGPGTEVPFKVIGKLTAIGTTDPAVAYESANCDGGAAHRRLDREALRRRRLVDVRGLRRPDDRCRGAARPVQARLVLQVDRRRELRCVRQQVRLDVDRDRPSRSADGGGQLPVAVAVDAVRVGHERRAQPGRSVEAQSTVKLPAGVLTLNGKKAARRTFASR
jgi:hypothetical protein